MSLLLFRAMPNALRLAHTLTLPLPHSFSLSSFSSYSSFHRRLSLSHSHSHSHSRPAHPTPLCTCNLTHSRPALFSSMQSQVHPDQPPAAGPAPSTKQLPSQRTPQPPAMTAYSNDFRADLVDQGNGCVDAVAALPHLVKTGPQRVSEGTQTAFALGTSPPPENRLQHPTQASTSVYPTPQIPLYQPSSSPPPPPTTKDYSPPPRLYSLQQTPTDINDMYSYPFKQQEQQQHQPLEQGHNHLNNHDLLQREPELKSSPSLSTTDLSAASIITSVSSPASSVSYSTLSHTLHIPTAPAYHVPLSDLHAEQCTPHSIMQRPRPSSCSPTKATDLSAVSNMSSLTTFPAASSPSAPSIGITYATPPAVASVKTLPSVGTTSPIYPAGQHPLSSLTVEKQQQQLQNVPQHPYDLHPELMQSSLPADSAVATTVIGTEAIGTGVSPSKMNSPVLTSPVQAPTLDIRKSQPGSQLVGDSAVSSSRQQQISQGEPSSRARRRQIYRRNTYSADLGSASFPRSDEDMELDELEDARRRMDALKKSSSRRMSKRKKDDDNERVFIGTRIGEGHVNYVLMYNMLTGIRVSVSRCNAKPQRALVDDDFTAAHKLAFDITGNELTPSSKYDFKFKDYAPWVFRHLREDFHIDASDYLVSLTSKYILSELGSPGKSGCFFYFSQDYRFIIKTIHHGEHKFMRKILKDYFNHVKHNPHTLLCRFFGLHRVKLPHGRKIHFVVMGNVFPPNRDIHETYDLKGSTLGRAISDEELKNNPRATQKDLNWVNRNRKLELGPEKRHLFVEQIKRDVELLARLNIMDYSLLIGIHDIERGNRDNIRDTTLKVFHPDTSKPLVKETSRGDRRESKANALRMAVKVSDPKALGPSTLPSDSFSERRYCIFYADDGGLLSTNEQNERGEDLYYLGIIDILTPYNYVKKIEHIWKSLSQDKHAISAVNPGEYAQRFLSFMIHAIKINYDVLSVLEKNNHPHSD